MTNLKTLNELLVRLDGNYVPDTNEAVFSINPDKRDISGVSKVETSGKKPLADRMLGFLFRNRAAPVFLRIKTGEFFDMPAMRVDTRDLHSGVPFTLLLSFNMTTPGADQDNMLRQLAQAFRNAEWQELGATGPSAVPQTPENSPANRLQAELKQFLLKRYREGQDVSGRTQVVWLGEERDAIAKHLQDTYGLDARVNLNIKVDLPKFEPEILTVRGRTRTSQKEVTLPFRAGGRLQNGVDAFGAAGLSQAQFRALMEDTAKQVLLHKVDLHEFRFETAWLAKLEQALDAALALYKRELVGFHVERNVGLAGYGAGPHDIVDGSASFLPAGWDRDTDAPIHFEGRAQVAIKDAALFEAAFPQAGTGEVQTLLANWLSERMPAVVKEVLHPIHAAGEGYAKLLENWHGLGGYHDEIQTRVQQEGDAVGLDVEAILTKPDRPEMELPKGVEIDLGELQLPTKEVGLTLNFHPKVLVRIKNFRDVRDVLNASSRPLDHVRDDHILVALKDVVRAMMPDRFYGEFESVEKGSSSTRSTKAEMEEAVRARLAGIGFELVQFKAELSDSAVWRTYSHLKGAASRQVEATLPYTFSGDTMADVNDAPTIRFDLGIGGVLPTGWGTFTKKLVEAERIGKPLSYDDIHAKVASNVGGLFQEGDMQTVKDFLHGGAAEKAAFAKLVTARVDEVLGAEWGLSGIASSATRDPLEIELALIEQRKGALQEARHRTAVETEKRQKLVALQAEAELEGHKAQVNKDLERLERGGSATNLQLGNLSAAATAPPVSIAELGGIGLGSKRAALEKPTGTAADDAAAEDTPPADDPEDGPAPEDLKDITPDGAR